jgi:beta-glucosidase
MANFKLNDGFLLGVASAATQIEGGDRANSWADWAERGMIKDGSSPVRATDHYIRWREDLELMSSLNIRICRFGIEWSRIEPQKGSFDQAVLDHYRDEIQAMLNRGIKPLLTLHHFSNPLWFERMGAFENDDSIAVFLRFVKRVIEHVGDLVAEYITINEPNVYGTMGYFYGVWPPGRKSFGAAMKVMSRLAVCHIRAYEIIHQMREIRGFSDTKVGFAHHMRVFEPAVRYNPWHRLGASLSSYLFQDVVAEAVLNGRFRLPLRRTSDIRHGRYYDFIGINYYTRSTVRGIGDGVRSGVPVNDLGWEIYPQGLIECARRMHKKYDAPIFITENGTCDENDSFRCRYIFEHLNEISKSDLPIERYYHWCFCDNFEWLEGESARFGLVHVDYDTQTRTCKQSGFFFSKIIEQNGVDEQLYTEYADQSYREN